MTPHKKNTKDTHKMHFIKMEFMSDLMNESSMILAIENDENEFFTCLKIIIIIIIRLDLDVKLK